MKDRAPGGTNPPVVSAAAGVARVVVSPKTEQLVWAGLAVVLGVVVAAGVWSLVRAGDGVQNSSSSPALSSYGVVPDFNLTERSGRTVASTELAGQIWVADFVFTNCSGTCPLLSSQMQRLQHLLRDAGTSVRLVSFSVDPVRDTPDVLREYADRYQADANNWLFLTGDHTALQHLIADGFRLSMVERAADTAGDSNDLITHSDRFVLVDQSLQIRGYYLATDADVLPRLFRDIATLYAAPVTGARNQ